MGGILAPRSLVVRLIASMHPCILRSIRIDKLYELDGRRAAPHIWAEENVMPIAGAKSTKRGAAKFAADHVAGGCAFMLDGDAVTRTTIPIASKAIGTLSRNSQRVGQLIESFGAALERMQRTGRAFRLMVDVEPKGALKIREINSVSDSTIIDAAPEVANANLDRALAAARERGQRRVAEILSDPDMLSADNLARLLGTTRATINTKRQNRQLLGLEGAARGFRFPSWQIGEDGKPFAALPTLFDRLGDSPWAVFVSSSRAIRSSMARRAATRFARAERPTSSKRRKASPRRSPECRKRPTLRLLSIAPPCIWCGLTPAHGLAELCSIATRTLWGLAGRQAASAIPADASPLIDLASSISAKRSRSASWKLCCAIAATARSATNPWMSASSTFGAMQRSKSPRRFLSSIFAAMALSGWASRGLCQCNGRLSARGATGPPSSDIQAASARHSANAAERLCL